eukprot:1777963-Pleurochrysis_carterae.AAC.1
MWLEDCGPVCLCIPVDSDAPACCYRPLAVEATVFSACKLQRPSQRCWLECAMPILCVGMAACARAQVGVDILSAGQSKSLHR